MTFIPGRSSNPAGRAVASRNEKTLAAEAALFDHAKELVDDLVGRANGGGGMTVRARGQQQCSAPLPIPPPQAGEGGASGCASSAPSVRGCCASGRRAGREAAFPPPLAGEGQGGGDAALLLLADRC
jgi:hypothetical protein